MTSAGIQDPLDRVADLIQVEMDAPALTCPHHAKRIAAFRFLFDFIARLKREGEQVAAEDLPGRGDGSEGES
jgi:hypothetical protein